MHRFTTYIAAVLLVLGIFTIQFEPTAHAQKTKQRTFSIEIQPDSPILIRDLTATVRQKSPSWKTALIEVRFEVENRSKKNVKLIDYGDRTADGSDGNAIEEYKLLGETLKVGKTGFVTFSYPIDGESLIYRIEKVAFEDGTEWNSKPFKAAQVKKSKPVFVVGEDLSILTAPRRTLLREWTALMFANRVLEVSKPQETIIEGVKIQTKTHQIKPERLAEVDECEPTPEQWTRAAEEMEKNQKRWQESGQYPIYTEMNYDVNDFKSYSFGGRVFAYEIPYYLIEAENQTEIGVGMLNFYVDETGDGTFRLLCGENVRTLEALPQWVKDLASK